MTATVIITGASGQLGSALHAAAPAGFRIHALSRTDLDITDRQAIDAAVRRVRPDWIINAAAHTAVDKAESDPAAAERLNAQAPGGLAEAARSGGARLLHVSTDYVFDGTATTPYHPDDPPSPINVYGQTKRRGEQAAQAASEDDAVIVRTAWLWHHTGRNFFTTMRQLIAEKPEVRVVDDQFGAPTHVDDLAHALWRFVEASAPGGVYHCTNSGQTTWYGFARAIREQMARAGLQSLANVQPVPSSEFPTEASRPAFSVLDCSRTERIIGAMRPWQAPLQAGHPEHS